MFVLFVHVCRYWSIAMFVYPLVCVVFLILGYNILNLMIVPPLHSVNTVLGKEWWESHTHTHTRTHAHTHAHTHTHTHARAHTHAHNTHT